MTMKGEAFANALNPQFSKLYQDGVMKVEPQFDVVFDVLTSKQSYEKRGGLTGFGLIPQKTKGANATELTMVQKDSKTFTHATYAAYARIEKEVSDDDLSGELNKIPTLLGVSARETVELLTAGFVDLFQTNTCADGKAIIATDHPRKGDNGTWSNRPATNAALSVTSLEAGLTLMRQTVDDWGNPKPLFPTMLVIPGMNEFTSIQLLKNMEKSGTTNRDINAIRERGLKSVIWDYLQLSGSWYLMTDPTERQLLFYWREKINGKTVAAPDTTDDALFMSRFRCSYDCIDARGIAGSYGS